MSWVELRGTWVDAATVRAITRETVEDYEFSSGTDKPQVAHLHCAEGLMLIINLGPTGVEWDALYAMMTQKDKPRTTWYLFQGDFRRPRLARWRKKALRRWEDDDVRRKDQRMAETYARSYYRELNTRLETFRNEAFAEIVAAVSSQS